VTQPGEICVVKDGPFLLKYSNSISGPCLFNKPRHATSAYFRIWGVKIEKSTWLHLTTPTLRRHNTANSKQLFSGTELPGVSPNFHIHVSVGWAIYIFPRLICFFCCRKIFGPILEIYKSLTDRGMWQFGLRPRNFQKRNTYVDFRCSVGLTQWGGGGGSGWGGRLGEAGRQDILSEGCKHICKLPHVIVCTFSIKHIKHMRRCAKNHQKELRVWQLFL
jgi:hypothetical protein